MHVLEVIELRNIEVLPFMLLCCMFNRYAENESRSNNELGKALKRFATV
ncbi:MAG: hypothetical protein ACTJLM_04840 [Ehrlichia sp.]